jgi:hypothetical protein
MIPPWRKKAGTGGPASRDRRPDRAGPGGRRPIRRAGLGLLYLAVGRREGFEDFGNTPDAYLASLAPLVAFALVTSVLAAAAGQIHMAILGLLVLLCSWLAPAVISHPLARRWGRLAEWPRYANILNWTQMLMFLVFSAVSACAKAAMSGGLPQRPVLVVAGLLVLGYALWFQWFVARGALQIKRWQTVVLLLCIMIGTNLLISMPLLVSGDGLSSLMK